MGKKPELLDPAVARLLEDARSRLFEALAAAPRARRARLGGLQVEVDGFGELLSLSAPEPTVPGPQWTDTFLAAYRAAASGEDKDDGVTVEEFLYLPAPPDSSAELWEGLSPDATPQEMDAHVRAKFAQLKPPTEGQLERIAQLEGVGSDEEQLVRVVLDSQRRLAELWVSGWLEDQPTAEISAALQRALAEAKADLQQQTNEILAS